MASLLGAGPLEAHTDRSAYHLIALRNARSGGTGMGGLQQGGMPRAAVLAGRYPGDQGPGGRRRGTLPPYSQNEPRKEIPSRLWQREGGNRLEIHPISL